MHPIMIAFFTVDSFVHGSLFPNQNGREMAFAPAVFKLSCKLSSYAWSYFQDIISKGDHTTCMLHSCAHTLPRTYKG